MTSPSSSSAIPRIGDRVRVEGHERTYFVVRVDAERQEVDVVPVSGVGAGMDAVAFAKLRLRSS